MEEETLAATAAVALAGVRRLGVRPFLLARALETEDRTKTAEYLRAVADSLEYAAGLDRPLKDRYATIIEKKLEGGGGG